MTRSSSKDLIQPFDEPKRVFHSNLKLFKTLSVDYSSSLEFDLFSEYKDHSEGEVTETMTKPTLREYREEIQADGSNTTTSRFNKSAKLEQGLNTAYPGFGILRILVLGYDVYWFWDTTNYGVIGEVMLKGMHFEA
ncbi:hypothetical protein Tco_0422092 [Tanacetum coccineum]